MSNTDFERRTQREIMIFAFGDVLIFGLGIGLILPAILGNDKVNSVTVVELHQDVIDLVAPHLAHPSLKVYQGDARDWEPPNGEKYDYIYFDIWPDVCGDYYEQTIELHKRVRKFRRKGGETHSWCRDEMRELHRAEASYFPFFAPR